MKKDFFTDILLPLDFSLNTELAVKKAIELGTPGKTNVHLFHVKPGFSFAFRVSDDALALHAKDKSLKAPIEKLDKWKARITEGLPGIDVNMEIQRGGDVEGAIIEKARTLQPDLIILAKRSNHFLFPFLNTVSPDRLTIETNCPVLTIKTGSQYKKTKLIVIPVSDHIPKRKLELVETLARKFNMEIHLLAIINEKSDLHFSSHALLETFRHLKEKHHCNVTYQVLHGKNRVKALLEYSQQVNADILLVNPSETKNSYSFGKQISDELPPDSPLQILAVQPAL
jgi:nucleotide-binding universal stress UspA family protein